jgi:hypothetical protein
MCNTPLNLEGENNLSDVIWLRESTFLKKKITGNKWSRRSTRAADMGVFN